VARWLIGRGIEAHTIHSSSVAVSREYKRTKTDRLDTAIRHYRLLGNRARERKLARFRQLIDAPPPPVLVLAVLDDPHGRYEALTGRSLHICPVCSVSIMQRVGNIPATVGHARPVFWADTS
jgi:hypothetical protein